MSKDRGLELLEVTVERAFSVPEGTGVGVVVSHPEKKMLIFVGPAEGAAIDRELRDARAERPSTHDLLDYVMKGFDIEVRSVVISAIVNNVYCATVILVRPADDGSAASHEVRIDARASDSIVLHLKAKVPLLMTRRAFEMAEDATDRLKSLEEAQPAPEVFPEAGEADEPDLGDEDDEVEEDDDESEP